MLPGQRGWAGQGFDEQDIRGKIGQHWDAWDQSGGVWQERKFITLTDHPHAESAAMLFIWEFFFPLWQMYRYFTMFVVFITFI